jgi:signal transduction histidine kinase
MHAVKAKPSLQVDYHMMLAGSPDTVVLLDIDSGMLVDVNPNAAALFGVPEDLLLEQPLVSLCPPEQPDGQLSSVMLGKYVRSVLGGFIRSFKFTFMHASGRAMPCEMRMVALPVPDRRLMHVRIVDITERNQDEKLRMGQGRLLEMVARGAPLQETLNQLMLLIESQSEGVLCSVVLLDEDGVTVRPGAGPSLDPAYMAALDGLQIGPYAGSCGTAMFRKETVIVSDIQTDPLWAPYRQLVAPYGLRACWSTPIYLDKDHVLGSFAMYYREVRSPSADDMRLITVATHLAGIAIERTRREHELAQHRQHLEVLVAARTAELSTALETLSLTQEELARRDKLAALGTLVAGVAHELNTPIGNSLVVATTMAEHAQALEGDMAEGLRRSKLENYLERAHEASDILIRNLHRAAGLVASFKQLAVDHTASQRRIFSLSELLAELALPLRIGLRQRPIKVELDIAPGLQMDSYPGPLAQVISTLFDNCLQHAFAPDVDGTIRINASALTPQIISMSVADTGAGIAPELLARVYDPFFTTRLGSGRSGLGLHVAHNIVTGVLGGRIELHSELGAGSTFTLLLPPVAPGFVTLA